MSDTQGWRPLTKPFGGERGDRRPARSPFVCLARTHAASAAGDAMVATALAGTIFFEGATSDARGKVLLYLVLTMAPFTLVAPLIGPALDRSRGGRRWMIFGSAVLRAVFCLLMVGNVESLWLYPAAFGVLVLQKGYNVARSAVVPSTVGGDSELVEANSKLQLISGLMGFAGAAPAALLFRLGGPNLALVLAVATFVLASVLALRLPARAVASGPTLAVERAELRSAGVLLAAGGMGLLRGIVGFLTLLLAFHFRAVGPDWAFAVVALTSILGTLLGSLVAPRLRRVWPEERMLISVLVATVLSAILAVVLSGIQGAAVLGFTVGVAATAGKLAFDSIVQRDAPDANRGRSFARFETRFQLIWVLGAILGLISMPVVVGFLAVALVSGFASFSYAVGLMAWRHRTGQDETRLGRRALVIDEAMTDAQAAARRRIATSTRAVAQRVRLRRGPEPKAGPPVPVPADVGVDTGPGPPTGHPPGSLASPLAAPPPRRGLRQPAAFAPSGPSPWPAAPTNPGLGPPGAPPATEPVGDTELEPLAGPTMPLPADSGPVSGPVVPPRRRRGPSRRGPSPPRGRRR